MMQELVCKYNLTVSQVNSLTPIWEIFEYSDLNVMRKLNNRMSFKKST